MNATIVLRNAGYRDLKEADSEIKNTQNANICCRSKGFKTAWKKSSREVVKKRYRTPDRLAADEPGDRCHVSTVEQHVLDFAPP